MPSFSKSRDTKISLRQKSEIIYPHKDWCDRNNKLVLVSYDLEKIDNDTVFKLRLEIFGYKQVFVQRSDNISDALNLVSKQAINFLLR